MVKKNKTPINWINHKPGKTITESDQNLFCLLTMNHHPIHLDNIFSKKSKFKKRLVVGTYTFSLAVGLSVRDVSFKAVANLNYSEVEHLKPVYLGDTINVKSRKISFQYSKNKKYIKKKYETVVLNQKKEKVLSFKREILFKND